MKNENDTSRSSSEEKKSGQLKISTQPNGNFKEKQPLKLNLWKNITEKKTSEQKIPKTTYIIPNQ